MNLQTIADLSKIDIEILNGCVQTKRNKFVFDGKEYDSTTEGIIDLVLAIQLHD